MYDLNADEMLMLSGIQHYVFCPRQWALINLDQLWDDNKLTRHGQILHQHVDDPAYRQLNSGTITLRSVALTSADLGLYGFSDAVELRPILDGQKGITHPRYPGQWLPYPVEYKRGKPKMTDCDTMQLVAQVLCLEEMYGIRIPKGALFYGEINRRVEVAITDDLRQKCKTCAEQMHQLYNSRTIPPAKKSPACRSCSLLNLCMPKTKKQQSVDTYLKTWLYEEAT